ncbi:MAG: hypothetical protein NTX24_02635 [Candidatus Pacearchaeota archaeon]|nr:hypothetical protein [Candidatus Pacearchaeota archaeon]
MKTKQNAVFYSLLAVFLLVLGFIYKEWFCFVGAGIISVCAVYWIWKSIKEGKKRSGTWEFKGHRNGKEVWKPIRYKQPLYRVRKRIYWKGHPTDDDIFQRIMQQDPKELRAYNYWVRRLNRRNRKKRV